MQLHSCPICGRRSLEQVLNTVCISARVDGERSVGGLMAYRCTENGHIFFVRTTDVEQPLTPPMSKNGPMNPCPVCDGSRQCTACNGTGELPSFLSF
jgi:hypothetical protein